MRGNSVKLLTVFLVFALVLVSSVSLVTAESGYLKGSNIGAVGQPTYAKGNELRYKSQGFVITSDYNSKLGVGIGFSNDYNTYKPTRLPYSGTTRNQGYQGSYGSYNRWGSNQDWYGSGSRTRISNYQSYRNCGYNCYYSGGYSSYFPSAYYRASPCGYAGYYSGCGGYGYSGHGYANSYYYSYYYPHYANYYYSYPYMRNARFGTNWYYY